MSVASNEDKLREELKKEADKVKPSPDALKRIRGGTGAN